MKNVGKKVISGILFLLMLLLLSLLSACQADFQAPSASFKVLYPKENNGQEHKSRNAGMSGSSGYSWSLGKFGKDN